MLPLQKNIRTHARIEYSSSRAYRGFIARVLPWLIAVSTMSKMLAADGAIDGTQFALEFPGGRIVRRNDLQAVGAQLANDRRFTAASDPLAVHMRIAHERVGGVTYQRTLLDITNVGERELLLARVVMLDAPAPAGARVVGDYNGSPIVAGNSFLGIESPFAENQIVNKRLLCAQPIVQPLLPGETVTASFVLGVAPEPSQLRRAFLAYLERERPRPYAPFLHYSTWYTLGFRSNPQAVNPYSEADALRLVATLGLELVQRRGVKLDCFLLDDGWDDTHTLWRLNSGWPEGLKNVTAAAARLGVVPGIWLSPWGGYGKSGQERLAYAALEGFEIHEGRLSLAGPRYYERFRGLCVGVARDDNVAFFKFDGVGPKLPTGLGAESNEVIDPAAARDINAMLRLVAELRRFRPAPYVSLTGGTWASPWWLLHVDNIWRGGSDHDFAGVGSARQQWLTYRDAQTFKYAVRRGPLFPLNSVMLHGIIFAKYARKLGDDPSGDFTDEVRSFFGTGTQLQELLLSPELLTARNWDDLADAAKWARANADTLRDVHWIGGDPAKLEPYGWAAWSPAKGIITLRNPSDKSAAFAIDIGAAFELPAEATQSFRVVSAYADAAPPVSELKAGVSMQIKLRPFEVLVLEAAPKKP